MTHWKRDCPDRKRGFHQNNQQDAANIASRLPGPVALTASLIVSEDDWVLDSGCTFHITPRREVLSDFEEFEGGKVMMGNNSHCVVRGKGKIKILNANGSTITKQRAICARDGKESHFLWTTRTDRVHLHRKRLSS